MRTLPLSPQPAQFDCWDTPAASDKKLSKTLRLVGNWSSSLRSTVCPRSDVSVCTSAVLDAVTSTLSLTAPGERVKSTFRLEPTPRRIPFAIAVLKPLAPASTRYLPGFKLL